MTHKSSFGAFFQQLMDLLLTPPPTWSLNFCQSASPIFSSFPSLFSENLPRIFLTSLRLHSLLSSGWDKKLFSWLFEMISEYEEKYWLLLLAIFDRVFYTSQEIFHLFLNINIFQKNSINLFAYLFLKSPFSCLDISNL